LGGELSPPNKLLPSRGGSSSAKDQPKQTPSIAFIQVSTLLHLVGLIVNLSVIPVFNLLYMLCKLKNCSAYEKSTLG